jgi:predicted ATPase
MVLRRVEIKNFRCFTEFELDLDEAGCYFVAANGGGKSSLLEAIAMGCGVARRFEKTDFAELEAPLEILLTVSNLPAEAAGILADETQFGGGAPTLTVGVRVTWDEIEQELEVTHGFPNAAWRRSTRAQREALTLIWLPADRDPGRSLLLGGTSSVLAELVRGLDLSNDLDTAADSIRDAAESLAAAAPLRSLLSDASHELGRLITTKADDSFALAPVATGEEELLRQIELLLSGGAAGKPLPVPRQSSGLAQLGLFAFVLRAISMGDSQILLLADEPELSLHPHAQRALAGRLHDASSQVLIATHSSNVLDRADPRRVVRLRSTNAGVKPARAGAISETQANRLMRISDPRTAEAFFAESVILVEGESDLITVRALAERLGRDLDAEGVSVISLEGAGSFSSFLELLGPDGLQLRLRGLCDFDHAASWRATLERAGIPTADLDEMNSAGFFICERDLEDEMFATLGASAVEDALRTASLGSRFDQFAAQPSQTGNRSEQLQRFLTKNKVKSAPALVDALALDNLPRPLEGLLAND